jgi:hypothetical protein
MASSGKVHVSFLPVGQRLVNELPHLLGRAARCWQIEPLACLVLRGRAHRSGATTRHPSQRPSSWTRASTTPSSGAALAVPAISCAWARTTARSLAASMLPIAEARLPDAPSHAVGFAPRQFVVEQERKEVGRHRFPGRPPLHYGTGPRQGASARWHRSVREQWPARDVAPLSLGACLHESDRAGVMKRTHQIM